MIRHFLRLVLLIGSVVADSPEKWVVYYDDEAPISAFNPYDVVALDAEHHPSIQALKERGKIVLGYISIGEVEKFRPYFNEVKNEGILSDENKNWPGSYFVDMRSPLWVKRVVEKLVPYILHKGFDGVILDTVDNAAEMEELDPSKNQGMVDGAANLIKAIRHHYPTIPIMMNRGYDVLPKVADTITMILGEDMMTSYDFKNKTYIWLPQEEFEQNIETVQEGLKINPKLKVYTLDYWDPKDSAKVEEIYRELRKYGFIPYVGTIGLDEIIPEPGQ